MKPIELTDTISLLTKIVDKIPLVSNDTLYSFDFWDVKHDIEIFYNKINRLRIDNPENRVIKEISDICKEKYEEIHQIIDYCAKDVVLRRKRLIDDDFLNNSTLSSTMTMDQYIGSITSKVITYMGIEYYEMV